MKRNLWFGLLTAASALALGALLQACEVTNDSDGSCDGSNCEYEGNEYEGSGYEGEGYEGEGSAGDAYRWVRICSTTPSTVHTTSSPGPDIDAVEVDDAGGTLKGYANQAPSGIQHIGTSSNTSTNPSAATGGPDVTSLDDKSKWVSIGYSGNYLIVGFDFDIFPGDSVVVYEVGPPDFNGAVSGESGKVSISVSDGGGDWWHIGNGQDSGFQDGGGFKVPDSTTAQIDTCP